jgi:hypothetical protein
MTCTHWADAFAFASMMAGIVAVFWLASRGD